MKTDQHPLKFVVVTFDLPFVLRLVDSIRRESIPDGYQEYTVVVNGFPMMLRFEKKVRNLGGIQVATEDRRGLLTYSIAQVWFDHRFFNAFRVEENYRFHANQFFAYALEGVNRFVELYRRETGSFWLRRVKPSEVAIVRMIGRRQDGTDDPYATGTPGSGLGLGSLVNSEQDHAIRKGLVAGWTPNELERFAYVVDALVDQEEHWSGALAAEIYFEARLARLLRIAFEATGVPPAEIDSKFETSGGHPRSVTGLIKAYIPELTGREIIDLATPLGQAFHEWAEKARDLRNDIAHGKQLAVSRNSALASISAVKNFLAQLEELLPGLPRSETSEQSRHSQR